jgi:long-chain acyl-CoA synthetase
MGIQAFDFVLLQTELECLFSSEEYIAKIISMKKDGLAKSLKFMVCFDPCTQEQKDACEAAGVKLYELKDVIAAGEGAKDAPFNKCTYEDYPLFSYTSGTTGDSKGVKLTHKNLLASTAHMVETMNVNQESCSFSYLPYTHSFE